MQTNNLFSLKRFLMLVSQSLIINKRMIAVSLAGFTGTLFLVLFVSQRAFNYTRWENQNFMSTFMVLFIFLGMIYSSLSFPAFRSREKSIHYLLLPSSGSEKFVFELLTRIIIFFLLIPFLFWIIANIEGAIIHYYVPRFGNYKFSFESGIDGITRNWRVGNLAVFAIIQFILFIYISMFAGACHFNRSPLIKTLFTITLIICGYILLGFLLFKGLNLKDYNAAVSGTLYPHNNKEMITILAAGTTLVNLFLIVFSWFRFKREGGLIMEFINSKGIFLQIADSISEKVLEGKYPPGVKIPSVRDLASEMGVNPNTVMRSLNELQSRGIIENKRGVGFYVNPEAENIIQQWKRKEFFDVDLPLIVRQTKILNITFEELRSHFTSTQNPENNEIK